MADQRPPRRPAGKKPPPTPPHKERKHTMSEPKPSPDSVFEVCRIRKLVELMKEHDLNEVDLRESRQRIRICRGPKEAPRPVYGSPPPSHVAGPSPQPPAPSPPSAEAANIILIKSPMV